MVWALSTSQASCEIKWNYSIEKALILKALHSSRVILLLPCLQFLIVLNVSKSEPSSNTPSPWNLPSLTASSNFCLPGAPFTKWTV